MLINLINDYIIAYSNLTYIISRPTRPFNVRIPSGKCAEATSCSS